MNENNNIKLQVLDKIQSGKVNMRPKFYFFLKVAFFIAISFITLIISSFLVSFIIFSIVQSGRMFLLGFGFRGLLVFFLVFPWFLLLIEIVLIVVLERLIKQFKFGYRSSMTTLVLMILCISIALSIIIEYSPIHPAILQRSQHKEGLPVVGSFYRELRFSVPQQEVFRGYVTDVGTSSFILTEDDDNIPNKTYTIVVSSTTLRQSGIMFGDMLFIAGHTLPDNTVEAYGLRKLSPQ